MRAASCALRELKPRFSRSEGRPHCEQLWAVSGDNPAVRPTLIALPRAALAVAVLFLTSCQCAKPGAACASDVDCKADAPYCSGTLLSCVACVDDAQCPSGLCLPDGTCGACGPSAACPQGEVCNSGQCISGCAGDTAGCPSGKFCLPGSSVCVDCTADAQCGPGFVCSPTNTCVPGCSAGNPACGMGQVCDVDGGACVGCLANAQCTNPQAPVCSGGTCVGCVGNGDCTSAAPQCNPVSRTCVACLDDTQCALGQLCKGNACVPGCSATHACPGVEQCKLPAGQCVQCLSDVQCGGTTPRCGPGTSRCVACLPGPGDNCPVGNYCRPDFVCERGCKRGSDCPSGVCLADRSCQQCTADAQCAAGKVCDNGTCTAACSATNPCGAGKACCSASQRCIDLQNDAANCGACGNACGAGGACCAGQCKSLSSAGSCGACGTVCGVGEGCCGLACTSITTLQRCGACNVSCGVDTFCDGAVCRPQTFPNFCANTRVYVVYDGRPTDDAAANVLASTIAANCSQTTVITYGQQSNPSWVDQTTGALLLGAGATVVTAGGPFPNKPVKWLETTRAVTKVYFSSNNIDTYYFRARSNAAILTSMTTATCSAHRDRFLIQLATDPTSSTLALIGYGVCPDGYGTTAAAYFWANQMLPNKAAYPDAWYIYDWIDTNNDSIPNAGDTFTKLVSGL
jgi:Cys-rich repeat protein